MAAGAVFCVSKITDTPRSVDEVCSALWAVKNLRLGRGNHALLPHGQLSSALKLAVVDAERALLEANGFLLRKYDELPDLLLAARLARVGAPQRVCICSAQHLRLCMRGAECAAMPASAVVDASVSAGCAKAGWWPEDASAEPVRSEAAAAIDVVPAGAVAQVWVSEHAVAGGCNPSEASAPAASASLAVPAASPASAWPRSLPWLASRLGPSFVRARSAAERAELRDAERDAAEAEGVAAAAAAPTQQVPGLE